MEKLYKLASENGFKDCVSSIYRETFKKGVSDDFHRIIILEDKSLFHSKFSCSKDFTTIYIRNMGIDEIKFELFHILESLESKAKGKKYLIRFACGLSFLTKCYSYDSNLQSKCCKNCYFCLPSLVDFVKLKEGLINLKIEIEKKFYKSIFIPTSVLPICIEDIHNEMICDHVSCCTHLFMSSNDDDYIVDQNTLSSIQQFIKSNITSYNDIVKDICDDNKHKLLSWDMNDLKRINKSLKTRSMFFNDKIEILLNQDTKSVMPATICANNQEIKDTNKKIKIEKDLKDFNLNKVKIENDPDGTIELSFEDFDMEKISNNVSQEIELSKNRKRKLKNVTNCTEKANLSDKKSLPNGFKQPIKKIKTEIDCEIIDLEMKTSKIDSSDDENNSDNDPNDSTILFSLEDFDSDLLKKKVEKETEKINAKRSCDKANIKDRNDKVCLVTSTDSFVEYSLCTRGGILAPKSDTSGNSQREFDENISDTSTKIVSNDSTSSIKDARSIIEARRNKGKSSSINLIKNQGNYGNNVLQKPFLALDPSKYPLKMRHIGLPLTQALKKGMLFSFLFC